MNSGRKSRLPQTSGGKRGKVMNQQNCNTSSSFKQQDLVQEIKQRVSAKDMFRELYPECYVDDHTKNSICPFHEHETPDCLQVQGDRDLAYCHGASEKFDTIDIYARKHGVSIKEAIKELAQKYEITNQNHATDKNNKLSRTFTHSLKSKIPDIIHSFYDRRGLADPLKEAHKKRQVGFLPGNDKFPACAVVPIYDALGDFRGYQMIYSKENLPLDGIDKKTRGERTVSEGFQYFPGDGQTVIVSGFSDALSVKAALPDANVISTVNETNSMKKLFALKFGDKPIIAFDRDKAGKKGTEKVIKALKRNCRLFDWNDIPEDLGGKDINDILTILGPEAIIEGITQAKEPPKVEQQQEWEAENQNQNQATILLNIVRNSGAELFMNEDGKPFVTFPSEGHRETWPTKSKPFKRWLGYEFFKLEGKPPHVDQLNAAIRVLDAEAYYSGLAHSVFCRTGKHGNNIYIDLCNDKWEVIKITKDGCGVIQDSPVKFTRSQRMKALPYPKEGGNWEDLGQLVNVEDEKDRILIISWLIQCFNPQGPYPILILEGEHGAAKTSTSRCLRDIVDPSRLKDQSPPKDERDLIIAATNSLVLAYDNLSGCAPWLSDAFCRLATGSGLSTRELYTDAEETLFSACKPLILSGIDAIATRADLADRSIILNLQPIPEYRRKTEKDLNRIFKEKHPYLLGLLCKAVSEGQRNFASTTLECYPRMADFAKQVVACEPALPWGKGEFMNAYQGNRDKAVEQTIESSVVGSAVLELMESVTTWEGTATELLSELEKFTNEKTIKMKQWPKAPHILSRKLKRLSNSLRKMGISYEKDRDSKDRNIKLTKTQEVGKVASLASLASYANKDNDLMVTLPKNESVITDDESVITSKCCSACTHLINKVCSVGQEHYKKGISLLNSCVFFIRDATGVTCDAMENESVINN